MELVLFIVMGAIAIAAALGVIVARKAIYSALFLLLNFCSLAGLYLVLNAQFLAAAQIIVYAGAIVVLFLFVTMLLGEGEVIADLRSQISKNYLAIALAFVLFVEVGYVLVSGTLAGTQGTDTPEAIASVGNVQAIGKLLFTDYLLPFELAAVLLLIGIVGAVVLAKKKPDTQYPIPNTQD